jgi:membrane associated rhomboid family serine protease
MFRQLPPVTLTLILANVAAYLLNNIMGDSLTVAFALWPLHSADFPNNPSFQAWQLVTYAFLHAGTAHLFFNMLALYMFGPDIERLFGTRRFTLYYFVCVIGAAVAQLLVVQSMGGVPFPTVGASGGIFGILLAFGMAFPQRQILLLFPPIPMPAWLFVTLYGMLELVLGVTGTAQGVAHFAHLGGMAAGFVLIQIWRKGLRP